jgi:hypothetical protein
MKAPRRSYLNSPHIRQLPAHRPKTDFCALSKQVNKDVRVRVSYDVTANQNVSMRRHVQFTPWEKLLATLLNSPCIHPQ